MRLAFCLYKYFPHSGLARDMLRIASEAARRGHTVEIYTRQWQGETPDHLAVHTLETGGWSNHGRARAFVRGLAPRLQAGLYDAVVGFNKMPGLDFYYAADGCFAARARRSHTRAYELTPRYRSWRRLEASVFGPGSRTRVLLLSEPSRLDYRAFYATADDRMRLLPPTLDRRHRRDPLPVEQRAALRQSLGATGSETLLLMVGSGYHTKGVDRTLHALAALPGPVRDNTRLVVVGRGKPGNLRRLAARLGIDGQVVFAGAGTMCRSCCGRPICWYTRQGRRTPGPCCWKRWRRACP